MGLEVAKKLASKGANVIIVARDTTKLEAAKKQVTAAARDSSKQRITWISADLTKLEENVRMLQEATEWNEGRLPDVAWQMAGSSRPDLFLDTSPEVLRQQMDTNYWSACYLAHTVLKAWTEEKQVNSDGKTALKVPEPLPRHLIFTTSVAAFLGIAGYNPYTPAKAAIRALADGLKQEMELYNGARYHGIPKGSVPSQPEIKISIIAPGNILSPGFEEEQKTKHPITKMLEEGDPNQSSEEVADISIKSLEAGNYLTTLAFLGHVMRSLSLNGSPRNGLLGLRDVLLGAVSNIAILFIGPDMEKKVRNFGKEHGVQHRQPQ
jgi:3-dehydrosphinganine reductase